MASDSVPPEPGGHDYSQRKRGYCGRLGGDTKHPAVRYVQTGFGMNELDRLTLVADIPGSNQWPIRELFQRDIDEKRVEREILPYLREPGSFRFFNPLTIAVLPVHRDGRVVVQKLKGGEQLVSEGKHSYRRSEVERHYILDECVEFPAYSSLRWNDANVRLVAIDGQHRLSALKRVASSLRAEAASTELRDAAIWTVPVIRVAIPELHWSPEGHAESILEAVRAIFSRVNMTAQEVNPSRAILLDDTSLISVCVQETLQFAHSNGKSVPLSLFDWRGDPNRPQDSALLSASELEACFASFIFGYHVDDWRVALEFDSDEGAEPLTTDDFKEQVLKGETYSVLKDSHAAAKARRRFREILLPAIVHLFRETKPFKDYIQQLVDLENEHELSHDDVKLHALDRFRFGHSKEDPSLRDKVSGAASTIQECVRAAREQMVPAVLRLDIGIRAMFSAFAHLKGVYDASIERTSDWMEFAGWFTKHTNAAIKRGLLDEGADLHLHVYRDQHGNVVNYRHSAVAEGLGAVWALKCVEEDRDLLRKAEDLQEVTDLVGYVHRTVVAQVSRELRPSFKRKFPDDTKQRNAAIKKEALKRAAKHLGAVFQAEIAALV